MFIVVVVVVVVGGFSDRAEEMLGYSPGREGWQELDVYCCCFDVVVVVVGGFSDRPEEM